MNKFFKIVLSALCVAAVGGAAALATACGSERITISGSSSVTPLMEALAAAYEETNRDVRIVINMSSSGDGIKDTQNGLNDFGMSSRFLKDGETGVKQETLCRDGIALVVNKDCTTSDVTSEQIKALYESGIAVNEEITAGIGRKEGSGTRDAFDELVGISSYHSSVATQDETGNVISVIEGAKNSLGYISYGSLTESSKIKSVKLDGVECNLTTIMSGEYALQRPFVIVLPESGNLGAAAQAFYEFIMSAEAQSVISAKGYVSIY